MNDCCDDDDDDPNREEDRLLSWGCGEFGQHCHAHSEDVSIRNGLLEAFGGRDRVKYVACGASHTIVVTDSDGIYSWGNGNSGQLGIGSTDTQLEPMKVTLHDNQSQGVNSSVAGVACGGRHSMIWLTNGQVFSFGNNFYAQLGYDFREKLYKENQRILQGFKVIAMQPKPNLLSFLVHRPVVQVSCGEKHTVFRFQDGAIGCVGCNAHGQIGMGSREEAVVPKILDLQQPMRYVVAGANHCVAITDGGEVLGWGYGKAVGNKLNDVLSPEIMKINTRNVVQVAGGASHSVLLSESGNVFTLGSGSDGQLGLGNSTHFLSHPRQIKQASLKRKVIQINAGESFSSAVTENGDLYMWGKNSHIILPQQPPSHRIWNPVCINQRTKAVKALYCGSWHAVAITGFPAPTIHCDSDTEDSFKEMEGDLGIHMNNNIAAEGDTSSESEGDFSELPQISNKKDLTQNEKETTKLSIAEFYEEEGDERTAWPVQNYNQLNEGKSSNNKALPEGTSVSNHEHLESARSRIVVQVPTPNVVHTATSPIQFSSSESGSERAASPYAKASARSQKKYSAKSKTTQNTSVKHVTYEDTYDENYFYNRGIQSSYEREKSCVSSHNHPAPIVQVSKTTAGTFALPRENTNFTSRQLDLTEIEYARAASSSKSPEKQFWMNKLSEARATESSTAPAQGVSMYNIDAHPDINVLKYTEGYHSKYGRHSATSVINLGRLAREYDGSPSKWNKSSLSDYGKQLGTPELPEEARRTTKLPLKCKPTSSIPTKKTEVNFALQISRSDTIIAPLKGPIVNAKLKHLKLNPLERYASVHNPLSSSKTAEKKSKTGMHTPRNVSIPGGRAYTSHEEDFCIQGQTGAGVRRRAMYSSATSWKEKSDFDRIKASQSSSPVLYNRNPASPIASNPSESYVITSQSSDCNTKDNVDKDVQDSDKENLPQRSKSESVSYQADSTIDRATSRASEKDINKNVNFLHLDQKSLQRNSAEKRSTHRKGFGIHRGKWQTSLPQTS